VVFYARLHRFHHGLALVLIVTGIRLSSAKPR
jgi:hypothetical protein